MFSIGVLFLIWGYAFLYSGVANLGNGFTGPTPLEALGMHTAIAPAGADAPNLTGQPSAAPSSGAKIRSI